MERTIGTSPSAPSASGPLAIGGPFHYPNGREAARLGQYRRQQSIAAIRAHRSWASTFFDTTNVYRTATARRCWTSVAGQGPRQRRHRHEVRQRVNRRRSASDDEFDTSPAVHPQRAARLRLSRRLGTDRIDLYQCHVWASSAARRTSPRKRSRSWSNEGLILVLRLEHRQRRVRRLSGRTTPCVRDPDALNVLEDAAGVISLCRSMTLRASTVGRLAIGLLRWAVRRGSQLPKDDIRGSGAAG